MRFLIGDKKHDQVCIKGSFKKIKKMLLLLSEKDHQSEDYIIDLDRLLDVIP